MTRRYAKPKPHQRWVMTGRQSAPPPATTSWWIGLSRDELSRVVREKQEALRNSQAGQKMGIEWQGDKR